MLSRRAARRLFSTTIEPTTPRIGVIGPGNIGQAVIAGIDGAFDHSVIVRPGTLSGYEHLAAPSVPVVESVTELLSSGAPRPEALVLAVKPQQAADPALRRALWIAREQYPDMLLLSMMAGVSMKTLERLYGEGPTVWAMPNTPCAIHMGAIGMMPNARVDLPHLELSKRLLGTLGHVQLFDKDEEMLAVTALSGSGPAYWWRLAGLVMECAQEKGEVALNAARIPLEVVARAMVEESMRLGLPREKALSLLDQTMAGSACYAGQKPDESLQSLTQSVMSPGGTTAAAMEKLESEDFVTSFKQGVMGGVPTWDIPSDPEARMAVLSHIATMREVLGTRPDSRVVEHSKRFPLIAAGAAAAVRAAYGRGLEIAADVSSSVSHYPRGGGVAAMLTRTSPLSLQGAEDDSPRP